MKKIRMSIAFLILLGIRKCQNFKNLQQFFFKLFELTGKKKLLNFTVQPGNLLLNSINVHKNLKANKKFQITNKNKDCNEWFSNFLLSTEYHFAFSLEFTNAP